MFCQRNQLLLRGLLESCTSSLMALLCLCVPAEEPVKEFTLPPTATKTSISDLSADVDYVVTISAYAGSEESLPISGQITCESHTHTHAQSNPLSNVSFFYIYISNLLASGVFWKGITAGVKEGRLDKKNMI